MPHEDDHGYGDDDGDNDYHGDHGDGKIMTIMKTIANMMTLMMTMIMMTVMLMVLIFWLSAVAIFKLKLDPSPFLGTR